MASSRADFHSAACDAVVPFSGIVWVEEAYPAAAAIQILHGKTIYRDFWFDKPPLVPALYLALGRSRGGSAANRRTRYSSSRAACRVLFRRAHVDPARRVVGRGTARVLPDLRCALRRHGTRARSCHAAAAPCRRVFRVEAEGLAERSYGRTGNYSRTRKARWFSSSADSGAGASGSD